MYSTKTLRSIAYALDECTSAATKSALLAAIETWVECAREDDVRRDEMKALRSDVYRVITESRSS